MTDSRTLERFRHIAIEGPIGAGKTTLARLFADRIAADLMLEQPGENPFLARFYDDRAGYAFQTQLFFLFQRERQFRAIAQPSMFAQTVVSDFMFAKDALFAQLNLSDEEYRLYAQMHQPIAAQLGEPDLVIRLQASAPTLLARVRGRAVAMEHGIDLAYLQRLCDAYAEFFASYDGAPVFAVDTERFHPIERVSDLDELVRSLERFDGRRGVLGAGAADIAFD
jgi:deoxyadenosine/deoxycytidine kinase